MSDSFSILTFGCRVNQADSLAIEADLRARGWIAVPAEEAHTVIVNTCSVTAAADQGARQAIRRVARANPDVRVVVTGCYATRRPEEIAALPSVTHVLVNDLKDDVPALVARDQHGSVNTAQRYGDGDGSCGDSLEPGLGGRTALTLRVQTGCEEQCSYCIIPQTRGRGRSLPLADVLNRIGRAVAAGYKEIVITGVHLGSYGRDAGDGSTLTSLVERLAQSPDDVLFRISSLEPMDCTPEIVRLVAASDRLAPHFHLPLQHGADRILTAMHRPYTAAAYARLVHGIHDQMPHASIGSDIIVGFPGETDQDFDAMARLVRDLPLTHLHVFPYSDRPGTAASQMTGKVDGSIIRERGRIIREFGAAMTGRFRSSQVGRTSRALTVDDGASAVTPNYLKVKLNERRSRNEWIDVRIEGGDPLQARVIG